MKRLLFAMMSVLCTSAVAGDAPLQAKTVVSVTTDVIGASAEVVEAKVTAPLEEALLRMRGTKLLQSSSRSGRSVIEFQVDRALACEVVSRLTLAIDDVRKTLPATIAAPLISARPDIGC